MVTFNQAARRAVLAVVVCVLSLAAPVVQAERIKDLVSIAGVRSNQLVGYGIVVGLDGTGDQTSQTPFTVQSIKSMLAQFGVSIPANINPQLKNVAAVVVHAELPPFGKPGQTIDITVSSFGNAKSLRGGSLIMTPLKGADGQVYAVAQGNLVVGGFGAEGKDGSRITVNVPSVGRIPNGATIERIVPNAFALGESMILNLHQPDFTTLSRISNVINDNLGRGTASAMDAGSIQVSAPADRATRVAFMSVLENLTVDPDEAPARVIINSRTGTVIIGRNVRLTAAAVSHGSLTVTITERPEISQPRPLSKGETVVAPVSKVEIEEEGRRMFKFDPGVSLDDLVRAVNQVGAAPGDIVAILEALKQAGALRAQLVVI
ncbi:MAG: flagellar basal body P-ring protein FlgI [Gammaproteobacteria bacterium]|nr:flagellar basal body P-ring protein FlgI [Gammaproteobacteria bacterium]